MEIIETTMKFRCVKMTPEYAQELLDKNHPSNRSPKRNKIVQYVADMESGFWQLTHQGVAVDVDGFLVDGQNRLAAIVRHGKPVPILLITGVPKKAILGADQGTNRNVGDVAKISGKPLPHGAVGFAAVARRMMVGLSTSGWSAPTIQATLDFIKEHQEALNFSFEAFDGKNKTGITQAPVRAVIARAWYRRNSRTRIKDFCQILLSGLPENPKQDSAAIRLRNWLLEAFTTGKRDAKAGKKFPPAIVYAKTEVALIHFIKYEEVQSLKETKAELFPLEGDPETPRDAIADTLRLAQ